MGVWAKLGRLLVVGKPALRTSWALGKLRVSEEPAPQETAGSLHCQETMLGTSEHHWASASGLNFKPAKAIP